MPEMAPEVKEMKTLLEGIQANFTLLKAANDQLKSEIVTLGSGSSETKATLDRLLASDTAMVADLKELAQKINGNAYGDDTKRVRTAGEIFTESEQFKGMVAGRSLKSGLVEVKRFFAAKDITSNAADGMTAGIPTARTIGLFPDPKQALRIRDLLPVTPISETSVRFVRYTFTNNAAIVYDASPSPNGRRENIQKPQSDMTMTEDSETAETIAHWVPASKQILQDIPRLRSIVDSELIYGLKFVEEEEILNGDGSAGHLNGLVTQAADYSTAYDLADDTMIDKIRSAILQARLAKYPVDGVVLSPFDWAKIETTKDAEKRYIIGDPRGMVGPGLWGKPIVESDSMTDGHFLAGAFGLAARLYDLEQANVETSDSHEDFFTKNMIAIRAEERLILVVTRPQAMVYGAF